MFSTTSFSSCFQTKRILTNLIKNLSINSNTHLSPIAPFWLKFVSKYKSLFKLLDAYFFLNIPLINTINLSWKYEKSSLMRIQTNDNLVILTHKIDTLIAQTTFLKKCEKCKGWLQTGTEGVTFICFLKYYIISWLLQWLMINNTTVSSLNKVLSSTYFLMQISLHILYKNNPYNFKFFRNKYIPLTWHMYGVPIPRLNLARQNFELIADNL